MNTSKKTLFLKSDKVGDGELGSMLIKGFLNAISQQENLPESIICVNSAILLTTSEDEELIQILKELENKGVSIYSCGTCLDYYKKRDDLKVGVPGNAMDTVNLLLNKDIVTL
ncbi:MAG: sulfurtransferase-like selenium metabolism protein YedF [Halarcobacter sp.]